MMEKATLDGKLRCLQTLLQQLGATVACDAVDEARNALAQNAQAHGNAFRRGYDQAKYEQMVNAELDSQNAQGEGIPHPDDAAVDRFAAALKAKLDEARAKGRSGWNNDEPGMQQRLSDMLRAHVEKGDPRDVGNFAMFLHQRGESVLPAQTNCDLQPPNDAGWDAAKANAERARVPAVVREVMDELEKAIRKFPTWPTDPLHAVGVFNEEAGELSKAVLQQVYEPHKNKPDDVRKEAQQAAAMALRFLVSLDSYDWTPGVQHDQPTLADALEQSEEAPHA